MPRLTYRLPHRTTAAGRHWTAALAVGLYLSIPTPMRAQSRPPLPNEPVAMEGAVRQFYRGLNVVVVTTTDGVAHVYNFTKDLIVHGGKKPGIEALEGLREGTTVAVHYSTTDGTVLAQEIDVLNGEGLRITEGVVRDIDRGKKTITIKFANGQTETLQMTSRAAAESQGLVEEPGKAPGRVVVYYADEAGRKVAHYFKKAS